MGQQTSLGFYKPDVGETGWGDEVNLNWDALNAMIDALQDGTSGLTAVGTAGTSQTINVATAGTYQLGLNSASCALTFTGFVTGKLGVVNVMAIQDATGGRELTYAGGTIHWSGDGFAPDLIDTPNGWDWLTFVSIDGGANIYAFPARGLTGPQGLTGAAGAAGAAGVSVTVKGNWTASTSYVVNDAVIFRNSLYVCTTAHTSSTTIDLTKWASPVRGLYYANDWADATAYYVGDIVRSSGTMYYCNTAHTSSGSINLTNFSAWISAPTLTPDGRLSISGAAAQHHIPGIEASGSVGTDVISVGQVRYSPLIVNTPITIDQFSFEVTAAPASAAHLHIGIYAVDPTTGQPTGTPVWDSGDIAVASGYTGAPGAQSMTSTVLTQGHYVVAVEADVTMTLRYMAGGVRFAGMTASWGTAPAIKSWTASRTYSSSYPSTPVAITAANSGGPFRHLVAFRVATP